MIQIGPYSFTRVDAERTIASLPEIWRQLSVGRDSAVIDGMRPQLTGEAGRMVEDLELAWGAMLHAGPALRAAGQMPARATGRVDQLSVSDGGVPKVAVERLEVGWSGAVGDRQATRLHHGRAWQALCLWSSEVIAELRAAGHSVAPGAAGENVTIGGLPWQEVRAGVRLRVGTVLCEVSAFSLPCRKNARWFVEGEFNVMHHDRGPVSRVYATVLEPGTI